MYPFAASRKNDGFAVSVDRPDTDLVGGREHKPAVGAEVDHGCRVALSTEDSRRARIVGAPDASRAVRGAGDHQASRRG